MLKALGNGAESCCAIERQTGTAGRHAGSIAGFVRAVAVDGAFEGCLAVCISSTFKLNREALAWVTA